MNKIDLIFYSGLNKRKGKGEEAFNTIKAFKDSNILNKAYIREFKKGNFKNDTVIPIPGGKLIPMFLSLIRKIIPKFKSRFFSEILFDFFMVRRMSKESNIVYFSGYFKKTLLKAKEMGKTVIFHCGVLHPKYNLGIGLEEFSKFNLEYKNKLQLEKSNEMLSLCDFIVVHSKFSKNNFIENGVNHNKIFVNPLGVDISKFKPSNEYKEERKKTFIFVGSASLSKGVYYLLEAWKQLNLKDSKLIICGKKEPEDWIVLSQYKNLLGVEFVGVVNPLDYYCKGIAFIFPSLTEGFPRVVSEALSSGIPVITTPPGSEMIREGENGFVIPIRDIESLKEKILFFYNNPHKAIEMGKKARKIAEEYTWDKYRERLINIIKKISEKE